LQESYDSVRRVLHEGAHGAPGRAFTALKAATNGAPGKLLYFLHKIQVHCFLG
jgi:hypothetical protein